jgi:phenylacetate-coenzyme A ligase PaaK-like adenylate-forming protein
MTKVKSIEKIRELLNAPPYSKDFNDEIFINYLNLVTEHHYKNCKDYRNFFDHIFKKYRYFNDILDFPYLPAAIFKQKKLFSIKSKNIFKTITSSATTGKQSSQIILDKFNNQNWTISMQKMLIQRLGNKKYVTILLDTPTSLNSSIQLTARSSMAQAIYFNSKSINSILLQKGNTITLNLKNFLNIINDENIEDIMIFSFTYILYKNFLLELKKKKITFKNKNIKIIHAGGWKKLHNEKISDTKLKQLCFEILNVQKENVIDIYGFSEQGGLLYPDCKYGFKHLPVWSDLIIRDPLTLNIMKSGQIGLMQFLTPIQTSYPGHSILTQDLGYINPRKCKCGNLRKSFKVIGRNDSSQEIRGCGDVMAEQYS